MPSIKKCLFPVAAADSVRSQMVKLLDKYRCSIVAIEAVPKDETSRFGIIHLYSDKVWY